jgi:hypothetical protein
VRKVEQGDYKKCGPNEKSLGDLSLHCTRDGLAELYTRYIPLVLIEYRRWLRLRRPGRAFVVGINAPPGSGKSTMVMVLVALLSLLDVRAESVSTDDMYMSKQERKEAQPEIHSRLDPRSIDAHKAASMLNAMMYLKPHEEMEWPCFDKGKDDRVQGELKSGSFDLLFLEGWRVKVAQGKLNGSSFDYSPLDSLIDDLMCIVVPKDLVRCWKFESTRQDHERTTGKAWTSADAEALNHKYDTWIQPFMEKFEDPLSRIDGPARIVIHKGNCHRIVQVEVRE